MLLIAIASMHLACDAKPYEKLEKHLVSYNELELSELLSKIPEDVDGAELLRRIQNIMGQEVRIIKILLLKNYT